ncbi:SDR family NAD(P)-dependent oxidoreductase [Kutzneria sp. CA-103260]|uniref:SDR family NAD(P)-dependent oxidoreductase n=1 Tax=Kutzneria sp. CA-103260 TaxID=2802641 RepID=UPI001BA6B885|nr:SDR family NAD(P)-dependent oxidoreductase [Kutzneria sp. CA-103260]QUQ63904.1 KR domain protein [Kutzneria sp. CA-103260]
MTTLQPIRPHLVSFDTDSFVRPVHRLTWHPVPAALDGPATPVAGRRLLVLGDEPSLVAQVADALRTAGAAVDEAGPDVTPEPAPWDGIIDLNVTGREYTMDGGEWRAAIARTTEAIHHRYGEWHAEVRADRCCYLVVTAMGGLMGYRDAGQGQPLGGIWAGLAKCLPRELPTLAVKVVDVDDLASLGQIVVSELSTWDLFEIGHREGTRYALTARRESTGPARFTLAADDVVLISGGARGVGFALARGLAERFGCRVVVTGRTALPGGEHWLTCDDAAYEQDQRDRISAARTTADLRAVRHRIRREVELRNVYANLSAAEAEGLRISYEACDCTDAGQVRELFARIPAPTVVVHNAGIDEPKRLDLKPAEEVVRTVDVKVTGFANLLREVLAEPSRRAALKSFCNVGSLAGRMGGMIGQIDYAAGNEALARLGFWARDAHGLPVQTLCWPTWERLGVIANYDAAVRYVSTIAPEDGVRRWIDEIHAAGSDEVMFIGQIGSALVPTQLRGFWLFTGHPDLPRLHALAHFLGTVREFEPFRRLLSSVNHRADTHPCLADFRVDGAPALPVSMLVEQVCAIGDWVVPEGWPLQHLAELRDLTVRLPALKLGDELTTEAVGRQEEDGWTVTITVTRADGEAVGSVRLVYREDPPSLPAFDGKTTPLPRPAAKRLSWRGLALGYPHWAETRIQVPAVTASDLWTSPFPPAPGISPAAVEAIVRSTGSEEELRVRRILVSPGAQRVDLLRSPDGGRTWVGSTDGRVSLWAELT